MVGHIILACYRINKLDNSHSLSQKSLEIPQEQGESVVTKYVKINSVPDKESCRWKQSGTKVTNLEKILVSRTTDAINHQLFLTRKYLRQ